MVLKAERDQRADGELQDEDTRRTGLPTRAARLDVKSSMSLGPSGRLHTASQQPKSEEPRKKPEVNS